MITYEQNIDVISNRVTIVATLEDGSKLFIPSDEGNSDYQAYLKSLDEAEQSTPMVTDEASTL